MKIISFLIMLMVLLHTSAFSMLRKSKTKKQVFSSKKYLQDSLFKSIQHKQHASLKNSLNAGADPNAFDSNRQTPLFHAVMIQDFKTVKLLLNAGALCSIELPGNMSLLHIVAKSDINKKSLTILDILLKNKAPQNIQSDTGYTALHYAIINEISDQKSKMLAIKLLLKDATSYNERTKTGLTPLHVTISLLHDDTLAQFFINCPEVEINAQTNEQQTPLIYAVNQSMIATIKYLLSRPDIEILEIDCYGKSALDYAKDHKQKEIAQLLTIHLGFYTACGLLAQQGLLQVLPRTAAKIIASHYVKQFLK